MRCEYCPLSDPEDVCPEAEGAYGIEFKDGALGCKHPRNWVEKRNSEHAAHYGKVGLDMGIEMDLTEEELARAIEICKHMVGLGNKGPYHRHGKAFYKAYRNYFMDVPQGNKILDKLPEIVLRSYRDGKHVEYRLTQEGLNWLGRQLKIKIDVI